MGHSKAIKGKGKRTYCSLLIEGEEIEFVMALLICIPKVMKGF
jgi:hypothetical protein